MQEYLALPLHEVRNRECLSVHSASAYSGYNTLVDVTILYAPIFTRPRSEVQIRTEGRSVQGESSVSLRTDIQRLESA